MPENKPALPSTIQHSAPSSPLPVQRDPHERANLGLRIEALLRHYWVAEVPEPVRVMMLRDWMDILDPFSQAEIDAACRAWLREHPREKPRPGDMVAAIGAARRALAPRTREPEPDTFIPRDQRMTAAKADEIVASIMGRKRFGGGEE